MSITANIILDICNLIFSSIGFLISIGIFSFIIYHRQQHPINTSMLLLCNTYIAIMFTCLNFVIMYGYSLFGELYENSYFNNWWCYAHAYIIHVGLCSIYYSYLLQTCFRFFRVVLYKYRQLHSFKFMFGFILIQWIISFILMIFILILHYFEYESHYYHCQISFSNFQGLLIIISVIYFGPTIVSMIIYIFIIYHVKHIKNQQIRYQSNQRDLIVLRRIIILIASMLILSLPTLILWIYYLLTGYLYPLNYHLEWLLFSISLSILSVASAILSPHLRRLMRFQWRRHRQIQPIVINYVHRVN
jgi:hypothetical protein